MYIPHVIQLSKQCCQLWYHEIRKHWGKLLG